MVTRRTEVVVIGAGPAGAVAATLLRRAGREVLVVERDRFPRFSIGESLLPQCMEVLEEAGLIRDVVEAGYQLKTGATFAWQDRLTAIDFRDKFTAGWGVTYQVPRAHFDLVLARAAERSGAVVRFGHQVLEVAPSSTPRVVVRDDAGETYQVEARWVLDASGFGRVLPRLLGLDRPSSFPSREAVFTHVADHIPPGAFDRTKIRITVHPRRDDVWYWLIPFSDGRSSLGVVAEPALLRPELTDPLARLKVMVAEEPSLHRLLSGAAYDTPARTLAGYSASVSALSGPGFALLGNAGEFLDPVFSSGVTIALMSARLAVRAVDRQLAGADVDWDAEFATPLTRGVNTFRAYVEAWYRGDFQRVLFHPTPSADIRRMIASILAGYAWDTSNPYVADPVRRLRVLVDLCRAPPAA